MRNANQTVLTRFFFFLVFTIETSVAIGYMLTAYGNGNCSHLCHTQAHNTHINKAMCIQTFVQCCLYTSQRQKKHFNQHQRWLLWSLECSLSFQQHRNPNLFLNIEVHMAFCTGTFGFWCTQFVYAAMLIFASVIKHLKRKQRREKRKKNDCFY